MENTPGWIKTAIILLAAAAAALLLSAVGFLVKLTIIAALLAYVLDPFASRLETRGMSRLAATSVIFLCIAVLALTASLLVLPGVLSEVEAIKSGAFNEKLDSLARGLDSFVQKNFGFMGGGDFHIRARLDRLSASVESRMLGYFVDIFSIALELLLLPIMVFFLLKDGRGFKKRLIGLVPNRHFEFSMNLIHKMDLQLGNYLRGQVIDACIVGSLAVIALFILDVKYYYLIGAFAGLANIIPYFGPIAGATLAVLVSALDTGSFSDALYIVIAFGGIKLLDDTLVLPIVMSRSVRMHPLLVLFALVIGGKFFGALGLLLAIPVTAVATVAIQETVYSYRRFYKPATFESEARSEAYKFWDY